MATGNPRAVQILHRHSQIDGILGSISMMPWRFLSGLKSDLAGFPFRREAALISSKGTDALRDHFRHLIWQLWQAGAVQAVGRVDKFLR